MHFAKKIKMRLLKNIILCALPGSLIFLTISGCANSLNQGNYLECMPNLEVDRQKARAGGAYSYKSQSFEECRAPAIYVTADD